MSAAISYLDHNATSPLRPEARVAMECALEGCGNPSSVHRWGREARAIVERARQHVANLVGADADQVIFTSGGTEANALALWSAVQASAPENSPVDCLAVSAIEHDSVIGTTLAIVDRVAGTDRITIPVTSNGEIDLDTFRRRADSRGGRALVAVMASNNETGVLQPIASVIGAAREAGSLCLIDAVQACGKIAIDFAALGADYLSISAHKIGGPQGVGALLVKTGAPYSAQMCGGGQERNRRAGTENLVGIAGFGAAAKLAAGDDPSRLAALRDRFESGLRRRFPDVVVFGEDAPRVANTSNFALPALAAETALIALDLDGVMVSSGAACSSGKVRHSHVLKAMGVSPELMGSALRVSLGWSSTGRDIDTALLSLENLSARVSARRAA